MLPEQLKLDPSRPNVNLTMCEASKIPDIWVQSSQSTDLVVVPSAYSQSVWQNAGISHTRVVPLGVDSIFTPDVEPLELRLSTDELIRDRYDHRVMLVGEDTGRKNLRLGIKSFLKAFAGRDDVCLLLKTSNYSGVTEIKKFIQETKFSLFGNIDVSPAVVFHCQILPPELVPNFFALGTCYFSVSHGEGADLSAMQSLAMGKPVLIPEHTGYLQYIDDGGDLVSRLSVVEVDVEMPGPLKRIYQGCTWYDVSGADVSLKLRELIEVQSDPDRGETFRETHSWRNTALGILEALREVSTVY